jgi:uncharacterized protein (TIGR00730 family)
VVTAVPAATLTSVTVFCGSSAGARPEFVHAARHLGRLLAERGLRLVYGGARVGTMGAIADAVLHAGGRVTGVIPRALVEREIAHTGIDDLRVVETMHERKAQMAGLGDAFLALPGGLGTLEELFEIWTWGMLGIHHKPLGLLDVGGYYAPLASFLDHAAHEGFIRPPHRAMALVDHDAARLLDAFRDYRPPEVAQVMPASKT